MTIPSGLLAALLVLGAPPAPREPECQPLFGPRLRVGRWGPVRVEVTNSSGEAERPLLGQRLAEAAHLVLAGGELAPAARRSYVVPFRPLAGDVPLQVELGETRTLFPERVASSGAEAVVEIGPPGSGRLPLPVSLRGRAGAGELPGFAAAYEGVDVLVVGEVRSGELSAAAGKALRTWFRAGGRVVITSPETLLATAEVFLKNRAETLPGTRAGWKKLLGAGEEDVYLWGGERPLVARFRVGFGRGLFLVPPSGGWGAEWVEAAKRAYRDLCEGRKLPEAPREEFRLYHDPDPRVQSDFPSLDGALAGAGLALRWALGAALLMAAAGALFWRRSRPGRFALAAAGAGLAAALLVGLLGRPPVGRVLRLRIEEFSADGAGVRAREYLYVEKVDGSWSPELHAAPGVLPSVELYDSSEVGRVSYRLEPGAAGEGSLLAGLEFKMGSLWLSADPLPGVAAPGEPPPGARRLGGWETEDPVRAIADCLAPPSGRLRAQAEFLAKAICEERRVTAALLPANLSEVSRRVTVCRLPDAEPALRVSGRVETVSLGRLGIFYGAGE